MDFVVRWILSQDHKQRSTSGNRTNKHFDSQARIRTTNTDKGLTRTHTRKHALISVFLFPPPFSLSLFLFAHCFLLSSFSSSLSFFLAPTLSLCLSLCLCLSRSASVWRNTRRENEKGETPAEEKTNAVLVFLAAASGRWRTGTRPLSQLANKV